MPLGVGRGHRQRVGAAVQGADLRRGQSMGQRHGNATAAGTNVDQSGRCSGFSVQGRAEFFDNGLHQQLRFRSRDQDPPIDLELKTAKMREAGNVLHRLAVRAAADHLPQLAHGGLV